MIPRSLNARLTIGMGLLVITALGAMGLVLSTALAARDAAVRYERMNRFATYVNEAAGHHAIERGSGNTFLGSARDDPALSTRLDKARRGADAAVGAAEALLGDIESAMTGAAFQARLRSWRESRRVLEEARGRLLSRGIQSEAWVAITTANIEHELAIATAAFAPITATERIIAHNTTLRADVAQLCEYAGRERAILGGHIASGRPVSDETLKRLAGYRALVEQAMARVLPLKSFADTPADLRRVVAAFEDEFCGPYQDLRERVYASSAEHRPYPVDGPEWMERATKAIDTGLAIRPVVTRLSEEATGETQRRANRFLAATAAGMAITVVISVLLVIYFRSVSKRLGRLLGFVGELQGTNRSARCSIGGHDEIACLAGAINAMLDDLRDSLTRERDAQRAQSEAEHVGNAKARFLANMSHEIRTPLTAIMGFAELLLEPALPATDRASHVETIRRNGEHLMGVINDVLDMSKIEAGEFKIATERCSVCRIVAEVAAMTRVRAAAKRIELNVRYHFPVPAFVHTDPLRLRQVLLNLVSNAVKFTNQGEVCLTVRADGLDATPSFITIEVADTGIGMSDAQLAELFQPFRQVDDSHTRRAGGTGLGLCLSKHLARLLGAELNVSSVPGRGSTFTLRCPVGDLTGVPLVHNAVESLAEPEPGRLIGKVSLRGRILLAEDGPDNQRLIGFLLRKAGAVVEIVPNGRLAVDAALSAASAGAPFDLILMDMQMPELDGYGATSELREQGYTGAVVALTAHAMQTDRERCLRAGCNDFATKPIQRDALLALVDHYLKQPRTAVDAPAEGFMDAGAARSL